MASSLQSPWALEKLVIGGLIRLNEGVTKIGRAPSCNIIVASDYVSKYHGEVQIAPGGEDVCICDLGSTNGLFVNGVLYNRATCRLKADDRIGIGVSVEDAEISEDGKYPMFALRRVPLTADDNVCSHPGQNAAPKEVDNEFIPPTPPDEPNHLDECVESDGDYDEKDDVDDFVQPEVSQMIKMEHCFSAPLTSLSMEPKNAERDLVSENIQSIFGDFNTEMLSALSNDSRQIAEAACTRKQNSKRSANNDVICISSDDEDQENVPIANPKSPELFDDSFGTENETEAAKEAQENAVVDTLQTKMPETIPSTSADESPIEQASPNIEIVNDNDEEDLLFTQALFDDLRDDPDSDIEITADYKIDDSGVLIVTPKKERLSQEWPEDTGTNYNSNEDDDYDSELETKVKKWSQKLHSQSFNGSFKMSPVYEDEVNYQGMALTESIFIEDSEGEEPCEPIIEPNEPIVEPNEPIVAKPITPSPSDKDEKEQETTTSTKTLEKESPLVREMKRTSKVRYLFESSSESEEEPMQVQVSKETTSKGSIARKRSTTEELPKKKPRLDSKSKDKNEKATDTTKLRRQSSSSGASSSKERSKAKDSPPIADEKEKTNRKHKRPPSSSSNRTYERKKSKESSDGSTSTITFNRSSSGPEGAASKTYMSATVARRKSIGHQSYVEERETDDFEVIKKPEPAQTDAQSKTPRGPVIINPPQLPVNRGKLRGISAVQQRSAEVLKKIQNQKDLKRKWLEKPSVAKQKEKAINQAIKEDRKQKLKELADKKNSDAISSKSKSKEKKKDEEIAIVKKPKVKFTSISRGALLAKEASKELSKPKSSSKSDNAQSVSTTLRLSSRSKSTSKSTTEPPTTLSNNQQSNADEPMSFSQELLKADSIPPAPHKHPLCSTRRRQKSSEVATAPRERAPPRRNPNKLTFESTDQYHVLTARLQEVQDQLARVSSMKSPQGKKKPVRKVRFNDVPTIHYIEPIKYAICRIHQKEPGLTLSERRSHASVHYPTVDYTEYLLSDVLSWSQLWLRNRRAGLNLDGSNNVVCPMPNQFSSIADYKRIVFPLLEMEYLSHLDRQWQLKVSKMEYNIQIEYCTNHNHRQLMFAKCSSNVKQSELAPTDLALISMIVKSETIQFFGYVGNIRKMGSCTCITIEVMPDAFPKEKLKTATKITILRIIEGLRVYFGSFNAVHQLEKTPLFEKILKPLDLLNVKSHWRPTIEYKGCDPLNDEQKDILLKTYAKAIDSSNKSITLIKGPPGTGKSRLITNLALQFLYGNEIRMLDRKILICAQSNMAVDVIARQLIVIQKKLSPRSPRYQVIRFGNKDKVHNDVLPITLSNLIQHDHKARLLQRSSSTEHATIGETLAAEIQRLEAKIRELETQNLQDVRQDELIEMRKALSLKKNFQNQTLGPEKEKQQYRLYLERANIVCTTLSSCVKLSCYVNYFDVCIIDEATQCIEPWTIMPLRFGISSLVMVGDTQQLPATVFSQKAKDLGLGCSLFTRIQKCLENNDSTSPSPVFSLHTQYRMHPEICLWPNAYFYKNELISSPTTTESKFSVKPFSIINLEYRQNENCPNGQFANSLEAEFVAKLTEALIKYIPNKFFSYGIITPYAQHRDELDKIIRKKELQNIMVNTIDSYQGIEKDVIIISNCRTKGIGFLANYQRLNVALTRPRKCLILCGNFKNLESVPSWASLLANARKRELFHNVSIADASDIDKNVIEKIKIKQKQKK